MNNARRKLEIRRTSAMPFKVSTPVNPTGSSLVRPCASDWFKIETKNLNSSCSKHDHGDIIIESGRFRTTKSKKKAHRNHIADRGQVLVSHKNMAHHLISMFKAVGKSWSQTDQS